VKKRNNISTVKREGLKGTQTCAVLTFRVLSMGKLFVWTGDFFGARNEILRGLMRAIDTSTIHGPYLIDTKIILERYLRVCLKAGLRYNGYIQLMKNRKEGGAVRNAGIKRRSSCRGPPLKRAILNDE
jgi:hypothetical protein